MIEKIIYVFIGGGLGSAMRFMISVYWLNKWGTGFPWHTLMVNVLGALVLGFVMGAFKNSNQSFWYFFLAAGFCGGFTTFSTFAYENVLLFKSEMVLALVYIALSVVLGMAAIFIGMSLTK